jgi:hypothetical protein
MDIIARPPIVQRTHNGWGTADVLTLELKMLYVRDRMKMFYPMAERGPGGPRYSRPGGRRYISKRNIFIRPKN